MQVYIAGPMRGEPDWGFPAFHRAERQLQEKGFETVNPARQESHSITGRPLRHKIPSIWGGTGADSLAGEIMRNDFKALLDCQAIVLLPGWTESQGALLELAVATACEMPVFELINGELHERGDVEYEAMHSRQAPVR